MAASRIVRSALVVLSILAQVCIAPAAGGQTHYSARINSLGGEVAGIVPDFYTDLQRNPAYASLSDAFTINYGYRRSPTYAFPFIYLNSSFYISTHSISQYATNEVLLHGFGLGDWKIAIVSEWDISTDDLLESRLEKDSSESSFTLTTRMILNDEASNYVHAAVSCSRFFSSGHIIGLRLGAFDYYSSARRQSTQFIEWYEYSEDIEDMYVSRTIKRHDYDDYTRRYLCPYVQLGLLLNAKSETPSEIMLKVSRADVDARKEDFWLDIRNIYDEQTGSQDQHHYSRREWLDRNGGDLWVFNLSGRHLFSNGVAIYAGGEYRTASSVGDWIDARREYSWRSYVTDFNSYATERGEGDYSEFSVICRAGKTFNLDRRIDVTAACNSSFRRSLNEDGGTMDISSRILVDDALETTSATGPLHLRDEYMTANLSIPVAIEFRPRPYFSLFASFNCWARWNRDTEEYSISPEYFNGSATLSGPLHAAGGRNTMLGATDDPPTIEDRRETMDTGYGATLGCSLNFRDRLIADLYVGSDITPDYLTNLIFDIRYRF